MFTLDGNVLTSSATIKGQAKFMVVSSTHMWIATRLVESLASLQTRVLPANLQIERFATEGRQLRRRNSFDKEWQDNLDQID